MSLTGTPATASSNAARKSFGRSTDSVSNGVRLGECARTDQLVLDRPQRRLGARRGSGLAQQVGHVHRDGADRDAQASGRPACWTSRRPGRTAPPISRAVNSAGAPPRRGESRPGVQVPGQRPVGQGVESGPSSPARGGQQLPQPVRVAARSFADGGRPRPAAPTSPRIDLRQDRGHVGDAQRAEVLPDRARRRRHSRARVRAASRGETAASGGWLVTSEQRRADRAPPPARRSG